MEPSDLGREAIEKFLSDMREGKLAEKDLQELRQRVKESEDFAWLYIQLSFLESALRWNYSTRSDHIFEQTALRSGRLRLVSDEVCRVGPIVASRNGTERRSASSLVDDGTLHSQDNSSVLGHLLQRTAEYLPTGFGKATVGFCLAASILMIAVFLYRNRPNATDKRDSAAATAGVNVNGISSIRLQSGAVRFNIDGVGWVIAEANADFELLNSKKARLTHGRIKLRVTEESGHGFVVETPYGAVTDLGTEFGLDLTGHDQARLVVFEGAVDLRVAEMNAFESRPH